MAAENKSSKERIAWPERPLLLSGKDITSRWTAHYRNLSATTLLNRFDDHLFHLSLRSRCTAMLAGLRTLIQARDWPGSIGAIDLLGNDALGTKPARMGEGGRPIFSDVLVK